MLRRVLIAGALFLSLALVLTWPALVQFGRAVPADLGDPLLNIWVFWWNAHAVPLTRAWWNAPAFYPATGALAYSEHLLGLAWLTSPLQWAGASPLQVYTVAFIASWTLAGLGAWWLARELTGRDDAALLAGVAFACAPYRAAQISHVQVLMACWMPVALAALHRHLESGRARWLVVFAAAWILQGLTNGYYLLFFGVLVALWIAYFTCRPHRLTRALSIVAASIVVALVMLPFLLEYRTVHERYGFERPVSEIVRFSADLLSLTDASPRLWLWGGRGGYHKPEGELFPGLTLGLVIVAGAVRRRGLPRPPHWLRTARGALGLAVGASLVLLVTFGIRGPWRADVVGLRLTVSTVDRPLGVLLACSAALLATAPGLRGAWQRRSPLLFYVAAAVVLWGLALGPYPAAAGVPLGWTSPYVWLLHVPGFAGLRVPARFWMPALVCLSVALALAWNRLGDVFASRRTIVATLVGVALVAEGMTAGVPMVARPAPWPSFLQSHTAVPVLEVPGTEQDSDVAAMYRATAVGRPIVGGYSGYFPPSWFVLHEAIASEDPSIVEGLASLGPCDVLVDRWTDRRRRWARWLGTRALREPPRAEGRWTLFALAADPSARRPAVVGAPLGALALTASVHDAIARDAVDGRLDTAWRSERQLAGDTITIDLGTVTTVGAVRTWLGREPLGYPRGLTIERSADGSAWQTVRAGGTAGLAWQAAIDRPLEVPLTVPLDGCPARYLRLRQTGSDARSDWVVAELEVFGPARGSMPCNDGDR